MKKMFPYSHAYINHFTFVRLVASLALLTYAKLDMSFGHSNATTKNRVMIFMIHKCE